MARAQLLSLGFSAAAIQHRIAYGRLHPVARGIYAVGWPYLDHRRRWAAAVLAAAASDLAAQLPTQPYLGSGTALSHRSAAALWGIGTEMPGRIDLSVRRPQEVRPLRFTHYEVRHEPRRVRSDLSRAAAMLLKRSRH